MTEAFAGGRVTLHAGDCLDVLASLPERSVDAVVTDPPYHFVSVVKRFGGTSLDREGTNEDRARRGADGMARLSRGFMGKQWDGGDIAFRSETWAAVLRVLKPGGHLVAFAAPKNAHRMVCAIEDAGFEIRDGLIWLFGTGFPKSLDVAKAIDKALGAEGTFGDPKSPAHAGWIDRGRMRGEAGEEGWQRPWMNDPEAVAKAGRRYLPGAPEAERWQGWGTALKPAHEPICLARAPLSEPTVAANVLRWGTGALNIDAARVDGEPWKAHRATGLASTKFFTEGEAAEIDKVPHALGRWPANVCHDGSDEVVAAFPDVGASRVGSRDPNGTLGYHGGTLGEPGPIRGHEDPPGSAARFFYSAKASKADRCGSKHPTVKPVKLMRWLVRLICPPGGVVLDPFAGTGTTGQAALAEGCLAILIEREAEYRADIARRMALMAAGPAERSRERVKARGTAAGAGPLFEASA